MSRNYIQIFSMTDHAKPLHDRYKGDYQGTNAALQVSEMEGGALRISKEAKTQQGNIDKDLVTEARILLAYRHTDTGVLRGTSEALIPITQLPWSELPGLEIVKTISKDGLVLKMWNQELELPVDRVVQIRFGKTIVYLRNYGTVDEIHWTEDSLAHGPGKLHGEEVDRNLTIAPPSGSGFTVKMGQETKH